MIALIKFEQALYDLTYADGKDIDDEFRKRVRRAINRLIRFKNYIKAERKPSKAGKAQRRRD